MQTDWSTYTRVDPLDDDTFNIVTREVNAMCQRFDDSDHALAIDLIGDARLHRNRMAHVIAVLRQAERCGGGYGFARQLLRYLGADQEGGRG